MAQSNPKKLFDRAIDLLKKGASDEAESLCRSCLSKNEHDVNFLSLLGSILLRKNDFEGAEKLSLNTLFKKSTPS